MNLPTRVRRAGIALLVVGLLAAIVIFATAGPEEQLDLPGVDSLTKRDILALEKMGGQSYVQFHDFREWFDSLWHGQRLAYTVAVLAVGAFLISRLWADFIAYSAEVDKANDTKA